MYDSVHKTTFNETEAVLTNDESVFGEKSEETFESWMTPTDNLVQATLHEDAEERTALHILNELYPESKNRSKKDIN